MMGGYRIAVVVAVVAMSLLGVVAFGAVAQGGEISDRSIVLLTAILGFLAPTIGSLLLLLRVESKVVEHKEQLDRVRYDLLNGAMRENLKRALSEDRHSLRNRETSERLAARRAGPPRPGQEREQE